MKTKLEEIYKNKKVLITGNTGFKGSWLSIWLLSLGADVYGISDTIPTEPSHYVTAGLESKIQYSEIDIRNFQLLNIEIHKIKPDFVFHLAAQPLVRKSYQSPLETIEVNVMGTANLLESLKDADWKCHAVMITSDKCYDNQEWTWGYRETDPVGGKDPYSASKGAAELVIKTYAHSYFEDSKHPVKVAVGRAGNVIGGGDWALDRIIPDCVKAWSHSKSVEIRNPHATRPWQHVLEPLSGYLVLGEFLSQDPNLNAEAFNFGPPGDQNHTVGELIEEMQKTWDQVLWDKTEESNPVYESGLLKLCCDKAVHHLSWKPVMHFEETVFFTSSWYQNYYKGTIDVFSYSQQQISEYTKLANQRKIQWAAQASK
jgi:CDP-glucose 4,6-dehydratase